MGTSLGCDGHIKSHHLSCTSLTKAHSKSRLVIRWPQPCVLRSGTPQGLSGSALDPTSPLSLIQLCSKGHRHSSQTPACPFRPFSQILLYSRVGLPYLRLRLKTETVLQSECHPTASASSITGPVTLHDSNGFPCFPSSHLSNQSPYHIPKFSKTLAAVCPLQIQSLW